MYYTWTVDTVHPINPPKAANFYFECFRENGICYFHMTYTILEIMRFKF
jgi:hypothetical protein